MTYVKSYQIPAANFAAEHAPRHGKARPHHLIKDWPIANDPWFKWYISPGVPWCERGAQIFIAESAHIDKSARIGDRTYVGPGVIIDRDVRIGQCVQIYDDARIHEGARIGNTVTVNEGACIGPLARLENWVLVDKCATVSADAYIGGRAKILEAAHAGQGAIIERHAKIGRRTRIGKRAFIDEFVLVGNDACIGDKARIGRNAKLGDRVQVGAEICIEEWTQIRAGARYITDLHSLKDTIYAIGGVAYINTGCLWLTLNEALAQWERLGDSSPISYRTMSEVARLIALRHNLRFGFGDTKTARNATQTP